MYPESVILRTCFTTQASVVSQNERRVFCCRCSLFPLRFFFWIYLLSVCLFGARTTGSQLQVLRCGCINIYTANKVYILQGDNLSKNNLLSY